MVFQIQARMVGLRGLESRFRRLPKEVFKETRKTFRTIGKDFVAHMRLNRLNKDGDPRFFDPRPGLFARTGVLNQTLKYKVSGRTLGSLRVDVGWFEPVNARKAFVHEFGAEIHGNPYLTVPLPAAMNMRGVPLKPSLRNYNNTFLLRRGDGFIVMQRRGENAIPIYALKSVVRIRPRLGFREEFNSAKVTQQRIQRLNQAVKAAVVRVISPGA